MEGQDSTPSRRNNHQAKFGSGPACDNREEEGPRQQYEKFRSKANNDDDASPSEETSPSPTANNNEAVSANTPANGGANTSVPSSSPHPGAASVRNQATLEDGNVYDTPDLHATLVDESQDLTLVQDQVASMELQMQERMATLEQRLNKDGNEKEKNKSPWMIMLGALVVAMVGILGLVFGLRGRNGSSESSLSSSTTTTGSPTTSPTTLTPTIAPIPRSFATRQELLDAIDAYMDAGYTTQGYGIHDVSVWNITGIDDLAQLFSARRKPNLIRFNDPGINEWDVSHATTLQWLFYGEGSTIGYHSFNQPLDQWNTGRVHNFLATFEGASSFNQDLDAWNTSSAVEMSFMFVFAHAFNGKVGNWDVSKVERMKQMYHLAFAFNQDISAWDVSSLITAEQMFEGRGDRSSSFNQPLNAWNVSRLQNARRMFFECNNFNQDLNDWNTSSLIDLAGMFEHAVQFNGDISTWDTSNADNFGSVFLDSSFNQDIGNWDTSKVTLMRGLFALTPAFNHDLGDWDVSRVTDFAWMFNEVIDFNHDLSGWNVSSGTDFENMFHRASSFDQDLCGWDWRHFGDEAPGIFEGTSCPFTSRPSNESACRKCDEEE